jgi:hypothetical protein
MRIPLNRVHEVRASGSARGNRGGLAAIDVEGGDQHAGDPIVKVATAAQVEEVPDNSRGTANAEALSLKGEGRKESSSGSSRCWR